MFVVFISHTSPPSGDSTSMLPIVNTADRPTTFPSDNERTWSTARSVPGSSTSHVCWLKPGTLVTEANSVLVNVTPASLESSMATSSPASTDHHSTLNGVPRLIFWAVCGFGTTIPASVNTSSDASS